MKKINFMRVASFLLVFALLTTCGIGGTFAKYVTEASGTDTARVAKWGVVMVAGGSLYSDDYIASTNTPAVEGDENTLSVVSSTEDNVVAPGTKNSTGFHFSITGKPEVTTQITGEVSTKDIYLAAGDYAVMTKVTVNNADDFASYNKLYTVSTDAYTEATTYETGKEYYLITDAVTVGTDYYPVVYKLEQKDNTGIGTYAKLSDIANGLVWTVTNGATVEPTTTNTTNYAWTLTNGNTFAPNTDLSEVTVDKAAGLDNFTITWEWAFETGDDENAKAQNNKQDTILGHLMAGATAAQVVYKPADGSYTNVSFGTEDTNVVKCGDTQVAYLTTAFDFDLTISQVD